MDDVNNNKNDKKVKNETPTPPEPKNIRLDRMEKNIRLLQDGLLTLINMVEWNNETITPIGTHNREIEIEYFGSLMQALETGAAEYMPNKNEDGN